MKTMKELLNVTSIILLVLGVIVNIIAFKSIGGEYALFQGLFWMGIVFPAYFVVSGLLVGKRSENILFVPVLSVFISISDWIMIGEFITMFIFIYLPFGYLGYFIGKHWRKKKREHER